MRLLSSRPRTPARRRWATISLAATAVVTLLSLGFGVTGPTAWWVGVALLLALAAGVGRTEAGLPVAWGVLFGPVAAGTLAFWAGTNGPAGVPEGLFWSVFITAIVGSVGFGLGRASAPGVHDPTLLGRDRSESRRWALGALVVAAAVFLALAALLPERLVAVSPATARFDGGVSMEPLYGSLPLLAGVAAVHASRNDGIAVCWFVAGVLPAGFLAMTFLFPVVLRADVLVRTLVVTAAVTAIVGFLAGTVGYVVGVSGRRVYRSLGARGVSH